MKTGVILLIALSFISSNKRFENKPIFKSIKESSYYAKRDGDISRESALKEKVERVEFYNESGELIEYTAFETDGSIYEKAIIDITKSGKPQKGIIANSKSKLKYYWIKNYDNTGNEIETKTFDSKNKLLNVESIKYYPNNKQQELVYKDLEYNYENKTSYLYNSKDELIEEIHYNGARGESEKRMYYYDEKGNSVKETLKRANEEIMTFISEYDELNNLILQKWLNENKKQIHETSFTYIYDSYGNWITKKRYSDKEIDFVWEREIQYY